MPHSRIISVIGLGYVGLPVAVAFGMQTNVIAFDISAERIRELKQGADRTREVSAEELQAADRIHYTTDPADLARADFHIVTVPTPLTEGRLPDLGPLVAASRTLGKVLKKGDIVVYESTVYPGATEEDCVPVLERESGLTFGADFTVGYSPERINPGDKEHRFTSIQKVVSGSDEKTLGIVTSVYGSVITAGVHQAPTIKVAEAAKVIENTQRDLNIALMNELALIFNKLGIDTRAVLSAAGTKWNFLPFRPGLVGGHCIGVDPYYLTNRAQRAGYHPEVILAGRRINDGMGAFIAREVVRHLLKTEAPRKTVTVLGLTFKENVPDIRNTRVVDIVEELKRFGVTVAVADPHAEPDEVRAEYGISLVPFEDLPEADAVVVAVAHDEYRERGKGLLDGRLKPGGFVADIKGILDQKEIGDDFDLWRL